MTAATLLRVAPAAAPAAAHAADALRALSKVAPAAARRAAGPLAAIAKAAMPLDPDARPLNRAGGPVELACSSSGPGFRCVVDIGGPPEGRLHRVVALLHDIAPGRPLPRAVTRLQERGRLDWGAWLGVRDRAEGPPTLKLYVELPSGADAQSLGIPADRVRPELDGRRLEPLLVGLEPGAAGAELYFELPGRGLPLAQLDQLLSPLGLQHRAGALVALAAAFEFRRGGNPLPELRFGFSYASTPLGGSETFTLFAFAEDLAGDDADIRRGIVAGTRARGLDLEPYCALSAGLAVAPVRADGHNMIGFTIDARRPAGVQISFRLPDAVH